MSVAETVTGRRTLRRYTADGNAPFLVFADADIDAAVEGAIAAKMRNGGEACTAANRFHVATAIADEFTTKLTARIATLRTGHGLAAETDLGPLITTHHRSSVHDLVRDAFRNLGPAQTRKESGTWLWPDPGIASPSRDDASTAPIRSTESRAVAKAPTPGPASRFFQAVVRPIPPPASSERGRCR